MEHKPEHKTRRTRNFALLIVVFLASLTAVEILIQQLNNPVPIVNNLLVFVLVNVNIILLVVLIVVVVRNLAKLYFERKNNILGAKFQTKLIVSFIHRPRLLHKTKGLTIWAIGGQDQKYNQKLCRYYGAVRHLYRFGNGTKAGAFRSILTW